MIPRVVAIEMGTAQTNFVQARLGLKDHAIQIDRNRNGMESPAKEGDSPVRAKR